MDWNLIAKIVVNVIVIVTFIYVVYPIIKYFKKDDDL